MATARAYPDQAMATTIDIEAGGVVNPPNQPVPNDGSVKFYNAGTYPVNIVFSNNTFPAINNLGLKQTSNPVGGLGTDNITVDYYIYDANNPNMPYAGPYSIEFGVGPLAVVITKGSVNLPEIRVPQGGEIQFTSDGTYPIAWTHQDGSPAYIWTPQPQQVQSGNPNPNPVQKAPVGTDVTVNYSIPYLKEITGKGTVHVGS